jgi:hypothetical protein
MVEYATIASRQETCAYAVRFLAEAQIEARRLELSFVYRVRREDQFPADHVLDFAAGEEAVAIK